MTLLNRFLGTRRWQALLGALKERTGHPAEPQVSTFGVALALLVGVTPVVLTLVDELDPTTRTVLPTLGFGVCAILAILVRWRLGLPFHLTRNWRPALSLTHTAVALGCVPAVILLIASPQLLADRHDLLTEAVQPSGPPGSRANVPGLLALVLLIAAWVSVVEEVIFRGLLVSTLRRWQVISSQRQRDIVAAVVSALIFGVAHYATWGPVAAVALVGLGLGFVAAYIANGEEILPVILYHFAFDTLSIAVSVF